MSTVHTSFDWIVLLSSPSFPPPSTVRKLPFHSPVALPFFFFLAPLRPRTSRRLGPALELLRHGTAARDTTGPRRKHPPIRHHHLTLRLWRVNHSSLQHHHPSSPRHNTPARDDTTRPGSIGYCHDLERTSSPAYVPAGLRRIPFTLYAHVSNHTDSPIASVRHYIAYPRNIHPSYCVLIDSPGHVSSGWP